jgi:flagellar biosynthesis protein FlhF
MHGCGCILDPSDKCQEGSAMKLKTYQAWTMAEALAFVKTDLGGDAVILHTRTFERGGFFGIGRRSVVEITAARAADMPKTESRGGRVEVKPHSDAGAHPSEVLRGPAEASRGSADALRGSAAARAYGAFGAAGGARAGSATPASAPLNMDHEREKTRRLAQAMAISLEKQSGERASASRNEDAVREAALARMAAQSRDAGATDAAQRADGPAQRFVLVPTQSADGPGGAQKLTAAIVRPPADPSPSAPAPSISPTHSSVDTMRAVIESKPTAGEGELDAISEFVGRVLKRGAIEGGGGRDGSHAPSRHDGNSAGVAVVAAPSSAASLAPTRADAAPSVSEVRPSPAFHRVHAQLVEQDVAPDLAARIMHEVARRFETDPSPSEEAVRAAVLERIAAILPGDAGDAFDVGLGRHGPRRIALVGPTGVGKTTTLAKIAANLKLKRGLRVGIVAADTYRIAAVDQLRTYAEILGLPVEVAASPRDAARACGSLSDVDVILIDTAGRSQNDHMKISELRAFLASAEPDETHLVLSATASARTLAREAEAFGALGVDRIVLTKLDEAASFGTLVSLVERLGKSVSFFTHGQEVPDHIEIARSRRLAALVLGSEVR